MTEHAAEGDAQPLALGDILAQRRRKVEELRAAGVDPFGGRTDDITASAAARARFEASEPPPDGTAPTLSVRLAGRLTAKREMGKSIFADLRDASGRIQLYVQKSQLDDEAFAAFKALDLGDIVSADGSMFRTRMGEVSLRVERFRLLAKSLRPLPEKWHGLTDTEQRYRQRYLDLISNEDVRRIFEQRCRIVRRIRDFLDARGFLEMETPMLQPVPGGAAARPFKTHYAALDCPMYLRIAPELYLKRLLVGGFEKVYEINRNFRNEGLSRRHNPEFTMIEIYQAYGDCRVMMDLTEALVTAVAEDVLGTLVLERTDGPPIDLTPPWRRATYAELVRERMGADWFELPVEQRRRKARELGLDIPADMTDVDVTHEVYEKLIEATLRQPTFVTRLPAALVPLAKRCDDDPDVVDVFELEINGQEIAPGYSELNDPIEQRLRFEAQARTAAGSETAESSRIDEDFLLALEHGMPPAGGMGIGIDRLVMLLTGAESIREVILFPQLRPLR